MIYPESLEVNGAEYEINTGYEYALACFACISDPDISDTERAYGVIDLLYKIPPDDLSEALRMAVKYLQRGKEHEETTPARKPDMEFDYDMHYIRSSFRSDYSIDLSKNGLYALVGIFRAAAGADGCLRAQPG
jgi:Bacteriophage Gp15 protein.